MRLSTWQSRALALALLLVVLGIGFRLLVVPVWATFRDNQAAIDDHRFHIARYQDIVSRGPALKAELGELEQSRDIGRYTLEHKSATLAAAAMQEQLKEVVERSGGRLSSTQVLPAETGKGFTHVALRVRMAVDVPALQQVLHALESNVPVMLVEDLVVTSRTSRRRRRRASQSMLDVRFKLTGLMPVEPETTLQSAGTPR